MGCIPEHDMRGEAEANAKFIVHAVNCHDELVRALESIVNQPVGHTEKDTEQDLAACIKIARAALTKATRKEI